MTTSAGLRETLLARPFPEGSLTVEPYEDWLARDAIGSRQDGDGLLHPGWMLIGALRGAGFGLDEIIELCGVSWDDGVMFGETTVEQIEPLRAGQHYVVNGNFLDVQHRVGRTVGAFDLMTYEITVEYEARVVARCVNSFVIPRRGK